MFALGVQIYYTMRCITDLNYVLMMKGHRDCETHRVRVAEKDHHVACGLQKFPLVYKDQNGLWQRIYKLLLAALQVYEIEQAVRRGNTVFKYSFPGIIIDCLKSLVKCLEAIL